MTSVSFIELPQIIIPVDTSVQFEENFLDWLNEVLSNKDLHSKTLFMKAILMHGFRNIELVKSSVDLLHMVRDPSSRCSNQRDELEDMTRCIRIATEEHEASLRDARRESIEALHAAHAESNRAILAARKDFADTLQRERDEMEKNTQFRLSAIESQHRAALAELELRYTSSGSESDIAVRAESLRHRGMYEDACERLDAVYNSELARESALLKQKLEKMTAELDISRRSNHGKGAAGEHCVASFLRTTFPESEINDTSRISHSCDLWMSPYPASGSFYAFECKNKGTITTKGDISKFYADLNSLTEKHGSKFMGGVFVSCRTNNIPGKGGLSIEVHAGRPVIFVGFDNSDFLWFAEILKVFMGIAEYLMGLANTDDVTTSDDEETVAIRLRREMDKVHDNVAPMLERVNRVRLFVDRIRTTYLAAAIDTSIQADKELRELFSEIANICKGPVVERVR
jgi:hypothetical protein